MAGRRGFVQDSMAGLLRVRLKGATRLAARDFWGSSDPYCTVTVGPSTYRSAVCRRTLEPTWDEDFVLYVRCTSALNPRSYSPNLSHVGQGRFSCCTSGVPPRHLKSTPQALIRSSMPNDFQARSPCCCGLLWLPGTHSTARRNNGFGFTSFLAADMQSRGSILGPTPTHRSVKQGYSHIQEDISL